MPTTDKGYTIIRTEYPPKPAEHEHNKPPISEVDYGGMVRCECGAVFTLKRIGAFPAWYRTWWFYPEHPDFQGFLGVVAGTLLVIVWVCWMIWGQY